MLAYSLFTKPYEEVLSNVKSKLEKANTSLGKQLGYSPIESMRMRIKSEESAKKKLEKKGLSFEEKNLKSLSDIAGLRVICKFRGDIPEIVELIKSWSTPKISTGFKSVKFEKIEVIEEQDYIENPKESGYRSYHMLCKKDNLIFEIQIRTISMDFWASAEHMLKYKFNKEIPEKIKTKLKSIANKAADLDESMDDIRQDVEVGTAKERLLEQINKAINILENSGLSFKAEKYKERLLQIEDNIEELKSLAIQTKEDVPKHYWID